MYELRKEDRAFLSNVEVKRSNRQTGCSYDHSRTSECGVSRRTSSKVACTIFDRRTREKKDVIGEEGKGEHA
jgi:hypothetical protein